MLRRLDARLHRSAAGRQRRLGAARVRRSATRACTRGRPSASPCCRWTRPSRSRSSSRSDVRVSRCRHSWWRHARAFADGSRTPAEPRDAATVVLLRGGDHGSEVYLLRRQASMAFAGGMCVFPGGGVDPRDFDHSVAWAGPSAAELGVAPGDDRGPGAGAGVRRGPRDVRGVRRAAGRRLRRGGRRGHHGRGLGARPAGPRGQAAVVHGVPRPARAGAPHRPARRLVRVVHADVRAEAVPYLVLRREPARPGKGRATCRPSRRR